MMTEIEKQIWAIINMVMQKSDLDQIVFDINRLTEKISYKNVNENAGEDEEKLKAMVAAEIERLGSATLQSYFRTLLEQNNLWLFEPGHYKVFAEEFERISKEAVFFQITTAVELSDDDLRALSEKLSRKMERKVIVDAKLDEKIIGGAIIKKDNYILDYSINTKLTSLETRWKASIAKAKR